MSRTRIGFVGVGLMGQAAHLRNYASLPECEVVALAESRPNLARAVAAKYAVPRFYADAEALLANEKLDGIVASQPFTKHGSIVPKLLSHGIPVLTEKPLAGSIAAGRSILAAEHRGGGTLYLGYHKRSDAATVRVKAQMAAWQASGEVGKLRYIRIAMPPGDWIAAGFFDNLKSDDPYPALADDAPPNDMDAATFKQSTAFVNYYIHQVNLMRHLLGEDYEVRYADPTGVMLAVHSKSGVCGTIEMQTHATSIDWQEEAFVAFEKGWIKLELPAPITLNRAGRVTIFSDRGTEHEPTTVIPTLPWIHAMRSQAINFVRAIKGDATPLCRSADALKDLEVAADYVRLFNASKG